MSKRELTPDVTVDDRMNDPDYITCLKARENMKEPCKVIKRGYDNDTMGEACWMGHILQVHYGTTANKWYLNDEDPTNWRGDPPWVTLTHRFTQKLGFADNGELFNFNDDNDHATVLAEFDKRLASWPNGYKG